MPRLIVLPRSCSLFPRRSPHCRTFTSSRPFLKSDSEKTSDDTSKNTSVHTGPGYSGRDSSDHAVNRSEKLDPQAAASHSGMAQHAKGEEGSQGLSRKDERSSNQRAKEDHPEAPGPVLGMNDERGGVSDSDLNPDLAEGDNKPAVEDRAQGYAS